jgi:peptide-methionine (S)-S-oxide reductase
VEAEFRQQRGVIATAVGYAGGHTSDPTYERVCAHDTGHAESVLVEYDPSVISYEKLLSVFWSLRDHSHPKRQGSQTGDQYRSVIFVHSHRQQSEADTSLTDVTARLRHAQSVEIVPAREFHKAEDYHQQFQEKGGAASCRLN